MVFNTGAALLDAIVLAVVARDAGGAYGYKITQDVQKIIPVSGSTLYPVLRRLQRDACFSIRDQAVDGRNRRYYALTDKGQAQLAFYREEWKNYSSKVSAIFNSSEQNGTGGRNGGGSQ